MHIHWQLHTLHVSINAWKANSQKSSTCLTLQGVCRAVLGTYVKLLSYLANHLELSMQTCILVPFMTRWSRVASTLPYLRRGGGRGGRGGGGHINCGMRYPQVFTYSGMSTAKTLLLTRAGPAHQSDAHCSQCLLTQLDLRTRDQSLGLLFFIFVRGGPDWCFC